MHASWDIQMSANFHLWRCPVFDCDITTFSVIAEGPLAFSMRAEGTAEKQRYFILLWEKKILIL